MGAGRVKKDLSSAVHAPLMTMAMTGVGVASVDELNKALDEAEPAVRAAKQQLTPEQVQAVLSEKFRSECYVMEPFFEAGLSRHELEELFFTWVRNIGPSGPAAGGGASNVLDRNMTQSTARAAVAPPAPHGGMPPQLGAPSAAPTPRSRPLLVLASVATVLITLGAVAALFVMASGDDTTAARTSPVAAGMAETDDLGAATPSQSLDILPPPSTSPTTPTTSSADPRDALMGRWIVSLGSFPASLSASELEGHVSKVRQEVPEAQVLEPNTFASITSGYYVAYVGPFDTAGDAWDYCWSIGRTNRDSCFGVPTTSDPNDRFRAYPDEPRPR